MSTPQTWIHSRKGRITGHVISDAGEWLKIRLAGDHELRYGSESNRGRVDHDAEVLTVRKSCLTLTCSNLLCSCHTNPVTSTRHES